ICLKALQKPPHRRYATATAMADDLAAFLDGRPIAARPISTTERFLKWVRRRPTTAAMLASAIVALVAMVSLGVWSYLAVTRRAHEAEVAKNEANAALLEGTRRLIRLNVANGTRLLDTQDYLGAPLWFAEALRLDAGNDEREKMHRIRLRAVFDYCPRISNVWLHESGVTDAQFDATGAMVVTASDDGTARLWLTASGEPAGPPLEHGSPVRALAVTDDATLVATGGTDGTVRIWEAKTSRLAFSIPHGGSITNLLFTHDGRTLLLAGVAGRIRGIDTSTGKERFPIAEFAGKITQLALSTDTYAAASADGTARVFSLRTGLPITAPLKHNNPVRTIAFAPDGTQIATGTDDGSVMLWNVRDGVPALPAALRHPARVNAVALSADGRKILTGCDDGHARVWDGSTGQLAGQPLSHDGPVLHIAPGPDGRLLASGSDDNTVRIWDSTTMEPVAAPFHHNATPSAVRFHPNGYEVLTADQTRLARVWNLITHGDITGTTTVELSDPTTSSAPTKRADLFTANSPDGTLVVTFGAEQSVRVRRTIDREPVTPPLRTGASITSAAFGPNGDTLVTGDADGNIMAW
ncbi:MAG: hypothetical protein ACRCZF_17050, partial [Gemmataceae bacterium]